jgi:hypothetical protein
MSEGRIVVGRRERDRPRAMAPVLSGERAADRAVAVAQSGRPSGPPHAKSVLSRRPTEPSRLPNPGGRQVRRTRSQSYPGGRRSRRGCPIRASVRSAARAVSLIQAANATVAVAQSGRPSGPPHATSVQSVRRRGRRPGPAVSAVVHGGAGRRIDRLTSRRIAGWCRPAAGRFRAGSDDGGQGVRDARREPCEEIRIAARRPILTSPVAGKIALEAGRSATRDVRRRGSPQRRRSSEKSLWRPGGPRRATCSAAGVLTSPVAGRRKNRFGSRDARSDKCPSALTLWHARRRTREMAALALWHARRRTREMAALALWHARRRTHPAASAEGGQVETT